MSSREIGAFSLQPFFIALTRQLNSEATLRNFEKTKQTLDALLEALKDNQEVASTEILQTCNFWEDFLLKFGTHSQTIDLTDPSLLNAVNAQFIDWSNQANGGTNSFESYFEALSAKLLQYPHDNECELRCIKYLIILAQLEEEKRQQENFPLTACSPLVSYYTKAFQLASRHPTELAMLATLRERASGLLLKIIHAPFVCRWEFALNQDLQAHPEKGTGLKKLTECFRAIDQLSNFFSSSDLSRIFTHFQKWLGKKGIPEFPEKSDLLTDAQTRMNHLEVVAGPASLSFIEHAQSQLATFRCEFRQAFQPFTKPNPLIPDVNQIRTFQQKTFERFKAFFEGIWEGLWHLLPSHFPCYDFRVMGSVGRQELCPYSDIETFVLIDARSDVFERGYLIQLIHLLKLVMVAFGETSPDNIPGLPRNSFCKGLYLDLNADTEGKCWQPARLADLQSLKENEGEYSLERYTLLRSNSLASNHPALHEAYASALQREDLLPLHPSHAWRLIKVLIEKYKTRPTYSPTSIDIKEDYLIPFCYLIQRLGVFLGIQAVNTLDIIDQFPEGLIDKDSAVLLKEAVAALYLMRVRIHFKYNKACDQVSLIPSHLLKVLFEPERIWLSRIDHWILPSLYKALGNGDSLQQNVGTGQEPFSINLFAPFNRSFLEVLKSQEIQDLIPSFCEYVRYLIDKRQLDQVRELYHFLSQKHRYEPLREVMQWLCMGSPATESLIFVPNYQTGFRYSYVQEYDKLQSRLIDLTSPDEMGCSTTGIKAKILTLSWEDHLIPPAFAEDNAPATVQTRYLKAEHFPHFFDQRLLEKAHIDGPPPPLWLKRQYPDSLHRVVELKTRKGEGLHFKERPTHGALEFAIVSLFHRLFGRGATPSILAKLIIERPNGSSFSTAIAISLSQEGTLLKDLIAKPDFPTASGINPEQWTEQLIAHTLILPSDAHGSNLMNTHQGNLISLDLEASFVPIRSSSSAPVPFVSELFCHDITPHLAGKTLEKFEQIQAPELLSAWLQELISLTKGWSALFEEEMSRLLDPVMDPLDSCTPKRDVRCLIPCLFPPGVVARLYRQIIHLQTFFKNCRQSSKTPISLDLLEQIITCWEERSSAQVGKHLAAQYRNSRIKHLIVNRPSQERLQAATGRSVQASQSSTMTLQQLLGHLPTPQEMTTISPERMQQELLAIRCFYETGIRLNVIGEQLAVQVDTKHVLSEATQKVFLQLLLSSQSIIHLALPNFTMLNNTILAELIKTNKQTLTTLDVRGCAIDLEGLKAIPACPSLKEVYLSGCSQLTALEDWGRLSSTPLKLLALEKLYIDGCDKLTIIQLHAPELLELKANKNKNLTQLTVTANVQTVLELEQTPQVNVDQVKEGVIEKLEVESFSPKFCEQLALLLAFALKGIEQKAIGSRLLDKLYARIGAEGKARIITEAQSEKPLTELNLRGLLLKDTAAKALAVALPRTQITQLYLPDNLIGDAGATALAKALPHTQITQLGLSGNEISKVGVKALADALSNPRTKITQLYLSGNEISKVGVTALAEVLPDTQITQLYLPGNKISKVRVKALAVALSNPRTQITELYLPDNLIGDTGATDLAKVLPHTQITQLYLSGNKISKVGAQALVDALSNPRTKITQLCLSENLIGDTGATDLAKVLPHTQITQLYLSGNKISKVGAQALADALSNPRTKITQLYLSENLIGDAGATALAKALPHTQITQLGLSGNKISKVGAQALADALSNPRTQITQLYLSHNEISKVGAQALAKALPHTQITKLDLSGNKIGDVGATDLAKVLPDTKITWLYLKGNLIEDVGAKVLVEALPHTQITQLNLSNNYIRDAGATALANALSNPSTQITQLDLSENEIGEVGATALAKVLPHTQITQLGLSGNKIRDVGTKALAEALSNPRTKITQLDLSWTAIGEVGATALAKVLPDTKITQLDLPGNEIRDVGAHNLAVALPRTQIAQLDLSHNEIEDVGAQALANALSNPSTQITQLDLSENEIGDVGAQALANALSNPSTQITQLDLSNTQLKLWGNEIGDARKKALKAIGGSRVVV